MTNNTAQFLKKYIRIFTKYLIFFIILIALFVLSLSLTSAYPNFLQRHIKYNIEYSSDRMVETESDWQFFFTPNRSSKIDNYADSLMLHITYCDDILPPLKAALAGAFYGDTYASSQVNNLSATVKGEPAGELVNYSRYWHGYRIWLKPLLVFFYYTQIRLFNSYVFYILLMGCLIYLYKKINWQASFSLLIVMIMLNITIIPMSLLFSCVFAISFLGTIVVLNNSKKHTERLGMIFFALGALTMFFDFYTYPFYSLGIPLFALLAYKSKNELKIKQMVKYSLSFTTIWFLGYIGTFLAKILLTSLVIGQEEFNATMRVVKYRLNYSGNSNPFYLELLNYFRAGFYTVRAALREMFVLPHYYIFCIIGFVWLILFPFFKKDKKILKLYIGYSVIFCVPLIWFLFASGPTKLHIYFQFRGIGLSILILIYFFMHSIDIEKLEKFLSKTKFIGRKDNNTK